MFYEPRRRNHGLKHDPFKSLVAPRPIGWISSVSSKGEVNLAPYSFFNAISVNPAIVAFASDGMKDSATNVAETGEFVCNIVIADDTTAMSQTSAPYPRGVNEFEKAGLEMEASSLVTPPRVKGIAAALECKRTDIIHLKGSDGLPAPYFLVMGEVVGVYINERFIVDGMIDSTAMNHLARLGYMEYAAVSDVFSLNRPAGG